MGSHLAAGHHPADDIDVEDLTSAMQENGFDLYLNGHVHTMTQYTVDGKGAYITSGAGSMVATADQEDEVLRTKLAGGNVSRSVGHTYQSVFNQKVAGFTLHTFDASYMKLTNEYVSYTGEVVHSFTISKSSPGPAPAPPSSCCFFDDAACQAGQTCCSSSKKSYASESSCAKYGAKHGCVWQGGSCVVGSAKQAARAGD